jgi:modulator of FtsH protease HflC
VKRSALVAIVLVLVAGVLLLFRQSRPFFIVHQTEQALILQFGEPKRVVRDPGLGLKIPFLQDFDYFDRRVLDFDAPSVELVLGDQKRLLVDAFARYRIANPLLFRQAAGTELAFRGRLEPIVFSSLRSVLGEVSLFTVLSKDRLQLMSRIRQEANKSLAQFGVEVVDIRIKRADLPPENSQAIFRRMQTERDREAKELRAQGAELGQRIRARADRERRVLIAEAQKQAEVLRGEGDAEAVRIFAQAYGADPKFFDLYRSLQAYRTALGDGSTSFVLSPDSPFFKYLNAPEPGTASGAPPPSAPGAAQSQAATPPAPAPARAEAPLAPSPPESPAPSRVDKPPAPTPATPRAEVEP